MGRYSEWLKEKETKELNEITITKLEPIQTNYGDITWNKNKSFNKFKKQIESRIKTAHTTEDYLYKILQKGFNLKYNECYSGTLKEDDDSCLIFAKSQFIVIFNKTGKFIRSIREMDNLDKIMCKVQKKIFECKYGTTNEMVEFIEKYEIDLDANEDGYQFNSVVINGELLLEVQKLCRICIEVNL